MKEEGVAMNKKIKFFSLLNILLITPTIVLADGDSYGAIDKLLRGLLNALSWAAYAIALGALIFVGIKYVMSGAQERANLKGKFILYVIGIALITMCATIASAVADTANKDGNTTPETLVDLGFQVAGIQVGNADGTGTVVDEYTSPALDNGDYVYTAGTDENGVTVYQTYDQTDQLKHETITGTDSTGHSYAYVRKDFQDGTNIEDLRTELSKLGVIVPEVESGWGNTTYTAGGIKTVQFSDSIPHRVEYEYEIPIYDNETNEEAGNYNIYVADYDNGFKYVEVQLSEKDKEPSGSVVIRYGADGKEDVIAEVVKANGKVKETVNLTENPNANFYEYFYEGKHAGIFNKI